MKQISKIIFIAALSVMISVTSIGCNNSDKSENNTASVAKEATKPVTEFDPNISIDKTVLHDEDGIKITADRIGKNEFGGLTIYLTCTNNTKDTVTFNAGSVSDFDGRVALTVNGQEFDNFRAAEGAYEKVKPENSSEMQIRINEKEAVEKGIYIIETIDLGISIQTDKNKDGEYLYPLTLQVKHK